MRAVAALRSSLAAPVFAQNLVTSERLVNALKEQQNWLTYWGDYSGTRYRDLDQINTSNVKDLRVEWIFQTGVAGAFQAVPLVVDGVMYFSGGEGTAFAIDARTGRQLWRYKYPLPEAKTALSTGPSIADCRSWASAFSWPCRMRMSSRSISARASWCGKPKWPTTRKAMARRSRRWS